LAEPNLLFSRPNPAMFDGRHTYEPTGRTWSGVNRAEQVAFYDQRLAWQSISDAGAS